ncbi:MAG: VapB-type antitoxin [Candidatus Bathyarchaeota archaeon]|nr:VapB-type antitoxin [Candidatus Bathyarchaeota archaeon]
MSQTSVIAVRVKKEVKETLEKAGVNISEAVRKHLEELFWKLRLKEETEVMRKILEKVKPSERGFAERSVRGDRESH